MKGWVVVLWSVAIAALVVASPGAEGADSWGLQPGTHQYERLDLEARSSLKVEVDVTSGPQVTMLLLDQVNFLLFEADRTYQAVHESTTMDHLTVTLNMDASTWYMVLSNPGSEEVQLHVGITWESGWSGSDLLISPLVLVLGAIVLVGAVVAYLVLRKGRGPGPVEFSPQAPHPAVASRSGSVPPDDHGDGVAAAQAEGG